MGLAGMKRNVGRNITVYNGRQETNKPQNLEADAPMVTLRQPGIQGRTFSTNIKHKPKKLNLKRFRVLEKKSDSR